MKLIYTFFLLFSIVNAKPLDIYEEGDCIGYGACKSDVNKINVHIIPHSHDDVGWINTVDQYFYDKVETVISSVIGGLLQNENRRFIQVETAYFKMWWNEQSDYVKGLVRKLVDEGRLEITGGAWSMNDEAAAHYQSTIDQFTLGLRYATDNLGKCAKPRAGWQIDPFGHSREQASLFAQMGMESVNFARLDYREKDKRKSDRTMDMLWKGSANLGDDSAIFTSPFYNYYTAPGGFNFDIRCAMDGNCLNDNPSIVTEINSPMYNWEERVKSFADLVEGNIKFFSTNNFLITFGNDFMWEAAERYYNNLDKLIAGFEKFKPTLNGTEYNVFYSTPSCYTKAVNDYVIKNNITLGVKTDDFFPYADSPNRVWSGYFSSRPTSKRYERIANNLLQVTRQLTTLGNLPQGRNYLLEEAVGMMQHHDAITGTEKDAVEKDYHRSTSIGIAQAVEDDSAALTAILGLDKDVNLKICPLANVSICDQTDKDEFNVILYNPLARTVSHYVQIPVTDDKWQVLDPSDAEVEIAITEPTRNFDYVAKVTNDILHNKIVIFKADSIPALGYKIYKVKKTTSTNKLASIAKPNIIHLKDDVKFGFDNKYIILDGESGLIKSSTINNVFLDLKQEILFYKASENSGAYIFRPDSDDRNAQNFDVRVENTVLIDSGNVVREIKQSYNDWVTQIIRIYKDEDYIEFDYVVGPISVDDEVGKEVILRYTTNIDTEGAFYTDSNGRELLYRKINWRPSYEYTPEEPQAGNYYPITNRIVIQDNINRLAVITDRSHGASSLNSGEVEIMVNRALLHDDGYGVDEALNEQEYDQGLVSRGTHYVTFGDREKSSVSVQERLLAQRKHLTPWTFYTTESINEKSKSFINKDLPQNVNLLTLDKWNDEDNTILIRLEHIFEWDEDQVLSKEVTVDLTDIFKSITIKSMEETLLAANIKLSESSRLKWPQLKETDKSSILSVEKRLERDPTDLKITLAPMQIRTFIATIERK